MGGCCESVSPLPPWPPSPDKQEKGEEHGGIYRAEVSQMNTAPVHREGSAPVRGRGWEPSQSGKHPHFCIRLPESDTHPHFCIRLPSPGPPPLFY